LIHLLIKVTYVNDYFNLRIPLERFTLFFELYKLLYDLQSNPNLSEGIVYKVSKLVSYLKNNIPDTSMSKKETHGDDGDESERPAKRARTQSGGKGGPAGSTARQISVYKDGNFLASFEKLGYKLDEEAFFPDWELLTEVRFGGFPPRLRLLILQCSYHQP
jgi:hypothetical protein